MSKQEDWWPSSRAALLLFVGLATGTAVVQRAPTLPSRPAPTAATSEASATGHASGLAAAEHVIELLAESIGVELDNFQARDAATVWRDYLCLKTPPKPDATHARMMAALDAVVQDLGGRPHAEIHPNDAPIASLDLANALGAIRAHTTFEEVETDVRKRQAVVVDYYDTAHSRSAIDAIEQKATGRGMRVQFVVAMLPDYIDSQTRRLFDGSLAGIQQAAGTLGYTLDRFHFPGWSADEHARARSTAHDSEPGALLFRRSPVDGGDDFLLVLVVTEMPTLGVHRAALRSAIALIDAWGAAFNQRNGEPVFRHAPLQILGPFFSGSVPSLVDVLKSLEEASPEVPRTTRIVTGTATDPSIGARLLSVPGEQSTLQFRSVVPDNFAVSTALLDYLGHINDRWRCGQGIALLMESNTAFGHSVSEGVRDVGPHRSELKGEARDVSMGAQEKCLRQPLEVRFPLHVSRLRAAVDNEAPTMSLLAPPAVKLRLTESTQPLDLIPSMTPDLTASVVDAALDNLLSALRRERFSAIGIFATDARDHLFLAKRIVRAIPDALMFGTQADLLYINPEYAPFLRGTLIASSYPAFNQTQLMRTETNREPRRQFTSAHEQGTYNAAVMLIAGLDPHDPEMVDPPFKGECSDHSCTPPPVWLSVIGSDGIWPIGIASELVSKLKPPEVAPTHNPAEQTTGENEVTNGQGNQSEAHQYARPITAAPPSIVAAAILVFGLAAFHSLGLIFALKGPKDVSRQHPHRHHRLRSKEDVTEAAKDLAAMCHWHNSRVLWNFYPPSDVVQSPKRTRGDDAVRKAI